jgi:hypothetical protein
MMARNSAKITPTNPMQCPTPLSQERGVFIPNILKEKIMEQEAYRVNEFCQRYALSKPA